MMSERKENEGSKERESWVGGGKKRKRKRQPDKQPKIIHFENNSNSLHPPPSISHADFPLPTLRTLLDMSVAHPHQICAPVSTVWATLRNPNASNALEAVEVWLAAIFGVDAVPYDS
jgi:hypothetical protein